MACVDQFEDLECWQACRELRVFLAREILPRLPSEERYRLGAQIMSAARSTTANLAEGFGRRNYLDNMKCIRGSLGALHECLDYMITACDEGMINDTLLEEFRVVFDQAVALSSAYSSDLLRSAKK